MSGVRTALLVSMMQLACIGIGWSQSTNQVTTSASGQPVVSGTIASLQRLALPPNAAIEVKVQDVTGGAKTVAETVFAAAGQQPPISFQLSYNPGDINPAHTYQVLANINVDGKPMFVTTTPLWVITKGAPSKVAILVQPAPAQTSAASGAKLRDTKWVLAEVNGNPAFPGEGVAAHFELHKKGNVTGSTGCNNLVGSYIASEGALQFTPAATTRKMCTAPVMQQEQALLSALKATTAYRVDGNTLELLNGSQSLAKFQAEAK
jgi:putative lipoprotein